MATLFRLDMATSQAIAAFKCSPGKAGRWCQGGVFLLACLSSCIVMRLFMRQYEFVVFTLPFALVSIGLGGGAAWRTLRLWRDARPIYCAGVLGLCAGLAGSGTFTLMGHVLAFLFPVYYDLA
jgi:hypothetical protein